MVLITQNETKINMQSHVHSAHKINFCSFTWKTCLSQHVHCLLAKGVFEWVNIFVGLKAMVIPDVHHQLIWTGYLVVRKSIISKEFDCYISQYSFSQFIRQRKPAVCLDIKHPKVEITYCVYCTTDVLLMLNYSLSQEDDEETSCVPWT